MGKINYGRVLLGGVAAGVVFIVLDMLTPMVTGVDWEAWAARHGLPAITQTTMITFAAMNIVWGVLLVWLYAGIRPRFGAGVRTAIIAGVFAWVFFTLAMSYNAVTGLYDPGMFPRLAAWWLVEIVLGALVGAWLYREA